jgi:hypothetical protein
MRVVLLISNVLNRKRVAQVADWAAIGVAVSLPWSTSATSILVVVWLITLLSTLDITAVRREVETAAGGLPVLLWVLAAVGMLWADVSWADRIHGFGGFHRLLVVPLLLAQFRRSEHGERILYGLRSYCSFVGFWCWLESSRGLAICISTGRWSGTALGKAQFSSYARLVSSGLYAMRCARVTGKGYFGPPG